MQEKSDLEASADLWFVLKPAGQFLPPSPRHMLNINSALISEICQKPVIINAKDVLPINCHKPDLAAFGLLSRKH